MRAASSTLTVPPAGVPVGGYGDPTSTFSHGRGRDNFTHDGGGCPAPGATQVLSRTAAANPLVTYQSTEEDSMSVPTPASTSTPDRPEDAAKTSIDSSLDHIERLAARQKVLHAAQIEAEEQVLHRIGASFTAGDLGAQDLVQLYYRLRPHALPGWTLRWDAAIPVAAKRLTTSVRHGGARPNGPDGSFQGTGRPGAYDPAPVDGVPVVYLIHDAADVPSYLGSTAHFRHRLKSHQADGKYIGIWRAWPCSSREDAYRREDEMLRASMPYLNKRASR